MQKKHFLSKYTKIGKRSIALFLFVFGLGVVLSGCGPAEEKIEEAREAYRKVAEANDAVVEAHKLINDASYDEELLALQQKALAFETVNMYEMEEEEIDALIKDMQGIITSYEEYLITMQEVKAAEDAAVLVTIPVSLKNLSSLAFTSLSLAEQGESSSVDLLTDLPAFGHGQDMHGLFIRRDVSNTPWILKLANADGQAWELALPVETYTEAGVVLALTYDAETDTLSIEEYQEPEKPETTATNEVPTGETSVSEETEGSENADSAEDTTSSEAIETESQNSP